MPSRPLWPPARRSRPLSRGVLLIALVALLGTGIFPAASTYHARDVPLETALVGACLGPAAPSSAGGTVLLVGSSLPLPSLTGVPIQVDYFYTEIATIGGHTNQSCLPTNAVGSTGAGGSVSVPLPIPPDRCAPPVCVTFRGPYGPLGFSTSGAPAGFFERDPTNGTSPATIEWEAYLYGTQLNRTAADVVSQNAPVHLSASAWDAMGNPATPPLAYTWSLAGHGWSILSQSGPNVTIKGIFGTWNGSLSATVNATFGTTIESVRSSALSLVPVDTTVQSATASPTPVDLAVPVTFSVIGYGASGYLYTATVNPGLGAGTASGSCTPTDLPNGTANLTCQVRAEYPVAGQAFPTASISNGYSAGPLTLAPISVRPVEQVQLGGPSLVTYPNRSVELDLNVTGGTGSAPYGPACLSPGPSAQMTCQFRNGTTWMFNESFPTPGRYAIQGSVTDRFGENVSASTSVLVVPLLSARVVGNSSVSLRAEEIRALSVVVAGGVFPITMWWNLSQAATLPCPEYIVADGTVSCGFRASPLGLFNLTVTLRDALGSEAALLFRITVAASPAGSGASNGLGFPHLSESVLVGLAGAVLGAVLLAAWVVRRRLHTRARGSREPRVEEEDLERMARGREHLMARADPVVPRPPNELVSGWTGPPVAPEEWAEWVAALVADGSLVPARGPDRRLVYRRAPPRPSTATIQFDPTVWEAKRASPADPPDSPENPDGRQGGG